MTVPETGAPKPAPLWPLALGVMAVIGGVVFLCGSWPIRCRRSRSPRQSEKADCHARIVQPRP